VLRSEPNGQGRKGGKRGEGMSSDRARCFLVSFLGVHEKFCELLWFWFGTVVVGGGGAVCE